MSTFDYRRKLTASERKQVAGIAIGAGAAVASVVAYFTRIMLQRESIRRPSADPGGTRELTARGGRFDRP